ncbi:hypothetical protein HY442_00190 [Candidatus Parcubacteria bacterium]|nr:hypothetical protein [Candidatus Parcubacteria bacterium]MBI4098931.1 hypothetical protein [Candidatus Parcubacteria bacterium]MBI4385538.1 hypothetical protein [Candidatus Parcubacteria bacterium]
MIKPIGEADHGEDNGAAEMVGKNLQDLQARLQEVGELVGWGKAVLDDVEGKARKLAAEYGLPGEGGENPASQR